MSGISRPTNFNMAGCNPTNDILTPLKREQEEAVRALLAGKDVLAVLPTGFGKSRIFEAFSRLKDLEENGRIIVLVVAPLTSIIKDQITKFNTVGFPATSLSELKPEDLKACEFKILFGSPEDVLKVDFKDELRNSTTELHKRLCCIVVDECHTVETWSGKRSKASKGKHEVAFRSAFGKLSTLRSLCKEGVPVLALTATADKTTQKTICRELLMVDAVVIFLSPHRENLRFSVTKSTKEEMDKKLDWLVEMVKEMGIDVPKTIIFCNTMKEISVVVNHLVVKLGKFAYYPTTSSRKEDMLLGIYHSVTWKANKEKILKSLSENGSKRIIVATTALSMGVNFLDVRYIVNWGPARSLLDQHQEAGRAGRDGKQSHVIIIYHGQQLAYCEDDVKRFVQTQDCYRVAGYKPFDASIKPLGIAHDCCSNCAKTCLCGPGVCNSSPFPFEQNFQDDSVTESSVARTVTQEQKECIREAFYELRDSMPSSCTVFGKTTSHAFSNELIDSIVENCHILFTLDDVCTHLPVFSLKHGLKILEIFEEVFGDIPNIEALLQGSENDFEDEDVNISQGQLHLLFNEMDILESDEDTEVPYISEEQYYAFTEYLDNDSDASNSQPSDTDYVDEDGL